MTGTIARLQLEKGFGFIKDSAGQDYFFHRSAVVGEGMENLREGDSVEFTVGQGPKGPRAESVRLYVDLTTAKQPRLECRERASLRASGQPSRHHSYGGSFTPSITRR